MKTIIFGTGYTGARLKKLIPNSASTELPTLCKGEQIPFDFCDKETWNNLPSFDQAIITFKMTDEELAKNFSLLFKGKRTIILSSARNLQNSIPNEVITEKTSLKVCARAKAESAFENQATILYLGLIWGPERLVEKWLSEGRIKNGNKYINFINVEDLCAIITHLLKGPYINKLLVSDGEAVTWNKIAETKKVILDKLPVGLESRRFNTERLIKSLTENFKFKLPYF